MGDISAWMFNVVAGINQDRLAPGFSHFIIKPNFLRELDRAEATYRSVNGLITSEWMREGKTIVLNVTVPPNTKATIYADSVRRVGGGKYCYII